MDSNCTPSTAASNSAHRGATRARRCGKSSARHRRAPPPPTWGDDLTDEDAFQALPEGALGVLVREEWRPTEADAWLQPPEGLLDFLDRWLAAEADTAPVQTKGAAG